MLQNLRFVLLAGGMFVLAYHGVSWIRGGAPISVLTIGSLKADARIPTFEESVEKGDRKHWNDSKTSQSDGNAERDKLRLAALQAANAYALSSCDRSMKANLVEALTAYTKLWREKMGSCGFLSCDEKKIDAAAEAFSSPLDMRVREAVRAAFDEGGISLQDFPPSLRDLVGGIAHGMGSSQSACVLGARPDDDMLRLERRR